MENNLVVPGADEKRPAMPNSFRIDDLWQRIKIGKEDPSKHESHLLKEVAFYAYHFEGETKTDTAYHLKISRPTVAKWIGEVERSAVLEDDVKGFIERTIIKAETLYHKLQKQKRYSEAWRVWSDLINMLQSFGKLHKEPDKVAVGVASLSDLQGSLLQYAQVEKLPIVAILPPKEDGDIIDVTADDEGDSDGGSGRPESE